MSNNDNDNDNGKDKDLFDDDLFGTNTGKIEVPKNLINKDKSASETTIAVVAVESKADLCDKKESSVSSDMIESASSVPSLIGKREEYPESYLEVVDSVIRTYKLLPNLNYAEIEKELSNLAVASSPTPTPQLLNLELQRIQGAKDRLGEIFNDVQRCYNIKKRAVDILRDGWGKYTSEKNAEGRKGDATIRISNFELDLAQTEAQFKVCLHILRNLDSQHESLSRRITTIQIQLKIFDLGRGSLPDFDFDKGTMLNISDEDAWSGEPKKEFDKEKPIEAEEQKF